jgi:type IV secretory pathway VirJ component
MRRPVACCLLAALACAAVLAAGPAAAQARTDTRRLRVPVGDTVTVWLPAGATPHVVLFITGERGWTAAAVDLARRMAAMPAVVIGVPFSALRRNGAREGGCWFVASDLELISHAAQKDLKLPQYHAPVLVGIGPGASTIFAALAAAPATTFAGGVSLAFCPTLRGAREICAGDTWTPEYDDGTRVNSLPPAAALPREWLVLQGAADRVCPPDRIRRFVSTTGAARFVEVPGAAHEVAEAAVWAPALGQALQDLWRERPPGPPTAEARTPTARELQEALERLSLPLEYRWPKKLDAVLLFYSGDGGWASLDESTAEQLVAHDIGVVGISSLRYFWSRKSPAEVAADMRRLVSAISESRRPIFVGGFSFGAEVVPVALGEWTEAERRALSGLVLISPSESASFEINPLDWIRRPTVNPATRVAPAVRAAGLPAIVVCGAKEGDTPCPDLAGVPGVRVVRLPGSHHFDGDYTAVADEEIAFIRSAGGDRRQ